MKGGGSHKLPIANSNLQGLIYGLVVSSDIALPDVAHAPKGAKTDIEIVQGALHWEASADLLEIDEFLRGAPSEIWMSIPGKLTMRVIGGRTITYQPSPNLDIAELRAYVLGSGLGALLAQRGNLVFHANAIAMPDETAIICMGRSGAGKSTTAAAMMLRGHQVLADDVCPVALGGLIYPGLTRMKLWDETADHLGIATAGLERIPGDRPKWNIPLNHAEIRKPKKPALFVLLDPAPTNKITAKPLTGLAKFSALRNNIYRPMFNQALGCEPECLRRIAELGESVPMVKVSRPDHGFEIEALVDIILGLHVCIRLPENGLMDIATNTDTGDLE